MPTGYFYIFPGNPGAAAELAATRKIEKYANPPNSGLFQPLALETLGTMTLPISDIGVKSNDDLEAFFVPALFSIGVNV